MKTIKLSLANMQGKLTRKEMKNIMAGSDLGSDKCCSTSQIAHCFGTQADCKDEATGPCPTTNSLLEKCHEYCTGSGSYGIWCS